MPFLSCSPISRPKVTCLFVLLWTLEVPGWAEVGFDSQTYTHARKASPRPCEQDVPQPRLSPETRFSIHLRTCIFPRSMHHVHLKWQVPMASQIHLSFPYAILSKRRSNAGPQRSVAYIPVAQTKVQTPPCWFLCFLWRLLWAPVLSETPAEFCCCQSLLSICGWGAGWEGDWCPVSHRISLHLPWQGTVS